MKRYHAIVEGRVQGVGFRFFVMQIAQELGLTGSVKNLDNGMVEIYVQGDESLINQFFSKIYAGNNWIRVDDITSKSVPIEKEETTFEYNW